MKKIFIIITFVLLMVFTLPFLTVQANADILSDLGFTTSSEDLENYDQRADSQPYNSKNMSFSPVNEEYVTNITDSQSGAFMQRLLNGDNDLGNIDSGYMQTENKYVKTVALDLNDEGKEHAVAELYYRETNNVNGELYLSIVNAGGEVEYGPDNTIIDKAINLKVNATNEILVYSNTSDLPLITDYKNQHTYLNITAGDYDNDGISEIAVYVPDATNPHISLYQIENGAIQESPSEIFNFDILTEFIYMTSADITGDNLDDLVVSNNGHDLINTDEPGTAKVYIFKSQDFSLSNPHIFNGINTANNGKNYFDSFIYNGAVAIGDIQVNANLPNQMELVVAGSKVTSVGLREISYVVLGYRYDNITGKWDFKNIYNTIFNLGSAELFRVINLNINKLTTLTCVDLYGNNSDTYDDIYIDGIMLNAHDDIYNTINDMYTNERYVDYGVVTGNFNGNSQKMEQLKILREKFLYNGSTNSLVSEGFEIATLHSWTPANELVELDNNIKCTAIAAPNTDDDTVIMKYAGHELQYSYPQILAALASPPYFEDLEYLEGGDSYIGNSSTEITSGVGSGSETHDNVTVSAGAYVSIEGGVKIFGYDIAQSEASEELTASYAWDISHEKEISTDISYGTFGGQDSVAVYTIPMDVYMFDVWTPGEGGKGGGWHTIYQNFPYDAAYVVIPVEKYNDIARREEGLPQIGGELFTHTLGKPETYPKSSVEMFNVTDAVEYEQFSTIGYGDAYTTQSIEITETDTNSHTFSGSLSYRAGAGVVGATVGVTFSIGGGGGWSSTSIKNVGYTGTVVNLPIAAEDYGYSYQWKIIAYPYIGENQSFPVINYAVQQVRRPALLPHNMEMVNSTKNSITLSWDNVDPNVTGFQLYRYYDFEGDLAGYYKIGDIVSAGINSYTDNNLQPYTYYKYKIQSIGTPYNSQQEVSILGAELTARTNPDLEAPLITSQPQPITVAAGSRAVFQIIAQPAKNASISDMIYYQWQLNVDGIWRPILGKTDNLFYINDVKEQDVGRYRCAISQYVGSNPITIYSDAVDLIVNKNNLNLIVNLYPNIEFEDINKPIEITASLENIDTSILPIGKVNFLITYYPDPTFTQNEVGDEVIEYSDPVLTIREIQVVNGRYAKIDWTPGAYGSYDIAALFVGDENYHLSTSNSLGFTCADSITAGAISGLRITGIENNSMQYGDQLELGATIFRNNTVDTLLADEITFTSSDIDGLSVIKTYGDNPKWILIAKKPGNFTLTATTTSNSTLKVTKNITVSKVQISLKAKDQQISMGNAPSQFELELIKGSLLLQDTLSDNFITTFTCGANAVSPAGSYDIFINSIVQTPYNNYEIISTENGTVTVEGPQVNIRFRGVSNGTVLAQINSWRVLESNYTTGYNIDTGSYIRFSAIPDEGYQIEKWVINGTELKNEGVYDTSSYITSNSLTDDIIVEVYFKPSLCQLSYGAEGNGTITATIGDLTVGSGAILPSQTALSFIAIPSEGYMINNWSVNNIEITGYTKTSFHHTITENTNVKVNFVLAEYVSVNYSVLGNGNVTAKTSEGIAIENGGFVTKGTEIIFTATPDDANSMIKEWTINGQVVQGSRTVLIEDSILTSLNIEVIFMDAITYTVKFGAVNYGSSAMTAKTGETSISSGDLVKGYSDIVFTANPPEGYQVKQWKIGSNIVQEVDGTPLKSNTFILEELKSSVTVSVEFESTKLYCVSYAVIDILPDAEGGENGKITAKSINEGISENYTDGEYIMNGSSVILTAVPDSGYTLFEWTASGKSVGYDSVYTINSLQTDHEIWAEFVPGNNPFTFASIGSGTITASAIRVDSESGVSIKEDIHSGDIIADGTVVTFEVIPNNGYQVKEWAYNGSTIVGSSNNIDITVNNGGYVEVIFEREFYSLILGSNLTASSEGYEISGNEIQGGKSITVTAFKSGYKLKNWYRDGVLILDELDNSYSFTITEDTKITADFEQQYYSVIFSAGDNGTLIAESDGTVILSETNQPGGFNLKFTANPADGYQVQSWYRGQTEINGQKTEGSNTETFIISSLGKTEYIRVYFEKAPDIPIVQKYTVDFSAGSGGSITASVNGIAITSGSEQEKESKIVFTAVSDSGKIIDYWNGTANGTMSINKLIFTIDSLSQDESVNVYFKNKPLENGGGSIGGGGGGSIVTSPESVVSTNGKANVHPSAGGEISLGDEATVLIPVGALQGEDEVEIKIKKVDTAPANPSGFMILGNVYSLTVDNQNSYNFDNPVTLTFKFDPSNVLKNSSPSVYYFNQTTQKWVNLGGTILGDKISVIVDHFTMFSVMTIVKKIPILSDISNHWANVAIEKLLENGAINGYPDNTFRPDNTITRAEFTTLLVNIFDLDSFKNSKVFEDTKNHWAMNNISAALSNGIVNGYSDYLFGPDDVITREQMAVMAVKASKLNIFKENTSFTDEELISDWARSSVATAVNNNIMKGYPDNKFNPKESATRAEAASVIYNILLNKK